MHASTTPEPGLTAANARGIILAAGAGVLAALAAYLLLGILAPDVLKAASGSTIVKPQNGDIISKALETINGNALWLILTGTGTAVTVVGLALMFGVRDASNWAFRIAGGIVIVFVVGPGLVA